MFSGFLLLLPYSHNPVLTSNTNPQLKTKNRPLTCVAHLQNSLYKKGLSFELQAQAYIALDPPSSSHLTWLLANRSQVLFIPYSAEKCSSICNLQVDPLQPSQLSNLHAACTLPLCSLFF